jgi:hypothetical protein
LKREINGDHTENKWPELPSNLGNIFVDNDGLIEFSGQ